MKTKVKAIQLNQTSSSAFSTRRALYVFIISLSFAIFGAFAALAESGNKDAAAPAVNFSNSNGKMAAMASQYTGVGPVVSGSVDYKALPSKARKFLEKHCDGHAVVKCQKEYTSGEYDIQLADGLEFEFDAKGNVIETEAPDGYSISQPLLKAVVPGKLYNLLIHNGFQQSVEAVHRDRNGYRIDVSDPVFKAITFDPSGVLTLVVND